VSTKIIAHHELTRIEIANWQDRSRLIIKPYSTLELRTQLASEFGYVSIKEAMEIVAVQICSAWGGDNELFIVDPSVNNFTVGVDQCKFRELNSLSWHREVWRLQREIRDVRSGWNNK